MSLRSLLNKLLRPAGCELAKLPTRKSGTRYYDQDGLFTDHIHDFVDDPAFQRALARGTQANGGQAPGILAPLHTALWVAKQALNVGKEGDGGKGLGGGEEKYTDGEHPGAGAFVECGVSHGFLSSAVLTYLNWNQLDQHLYLFDTFRGLDERFVTATEKANGRMKFSEQYFSECFDQVQKNFAEFERVHLIRGTVPETLTQVDIKNVCYLSLDMNCVQPEIAAAEFFWERMLPGGLILLDDYGFLGFEEQHEAFNRFARDRQVEILRLPTGQGLIVKTPRK